MAKISFTGFYPSRPYWAVSRVNFHVPRVDRWFHDQMAEVMFSRDTDALSLRISRDGEILIRIARLESNAPNTVPSPIEDEDTVRRWGEYLDYLNTFYLLLDSATIERDHRAYFNLHEITTRDAFRVSYEDGKRIDENIANESIASVFQTARFVGTYRSESDIEHHPLIVMRAVISRDAISHAASEFERIVASAGAEKTLASFAKSLSEYKVGNYETCIVLAWFVTEAAISSLWERQLDALNQDLPDGRRRINSDRRHFLTGRDLPTSVVSNLLELFGAVDHELFEDIDKVRRFRNQIVHPTQFTPRAAEAQLAMGTALSMIRRIWNIHLTPSLGYSVPGL
jgi:hypothetical protein